MAISFAILEQFRVIHDFVFADQAGRVRCIVICINSTPNQMIDGMNRTTHSKFSNTQRDTTNLAIKNFAIACLVLTIFLRCD